MSECHNDGKCSEYYDCCDCGYDKNNDEWLGACCAYCWSCNACDECMDERE